MSEHEDRRNWTRREVLGEVLLPAAGVVLLGGEGAAQRRVGQWRTFKTSEVFRQVLR